MALRYFSEAIDLRDDAFNRSYRAKEFFGLDDCENSMGDSKVVLTQEPYAEPGFHTLVDAWTVMGICQIRAGQYKSGILHLEKAKELACPSGYPAHEIEYLRRLHGKATDALGAAGSDGSADG